MTGAKSPTALAVAPFLIVALASVAPAWGEQSRADTFGPTQALSHTYRLALAVPSVANGRSIAPASIPPQRGLASWYGQHWAAHRTASGEPYEPKQMTAAHRSLPFGTMVKVTNLANHRSVTVRINDRGPYHGGRIIDLSDAAAARLGFKHDGIVRVKLEIATTQRPADTKLARNE